LFDEEVGNRLIRLTCAGVAAKAIEEVSQPLMIEAEWPAGLRSGDVLAESFNARRWAERYRANRTMVNGFVIS